MLIGHLTQTDHELGKLDPRRLDEIADAVWQDIKNDEAIDKAFLQNPVLMKQLHTAVARTLKVDDQHK
jgi:hypothetical protein